MKIILKDEVAGLGDEGEILNVSDGYARNYLLPSKKAVMCNSQNLSVLRSQQSSIEKRRIERKANYQSLKEKIEQLNLNIKMKTGETGHLFGAVTSMLIADELEKIGIEIPKKNIIVPHHSIKELGEYVIEIKLFGNLSAKLQIIVEDIEGKNNIAVEHATQDSQLDEVPESINDSEAVVDSVENDVEESTHQE